MASKARRFADDGWAVWIDGEDKSTIYMNNWVNPKGSSFIDVGIRVMGSKNAGDINIYVPFQLEKEEVEDVSPHLQDESILRAIFNSYCTLTPENEHVSIIHYEDRKLDLIGLDLNHVRLRSVSKGTLITIEMSKLKDYLVSEEAYIIFRLPQKSLNEIFRTKLDIDHTVRSVKEILLSPMITKEYGYSIRINEARLLPPEISNSEELHNQNIKKVLITLSIDELYNVNDANCYRISRLEEELYKSYIPAGYESGGAITYQWVERRIESMKAHFNFYFDLSCSNMSKKSILLYLLLLMCNALVANTVYDLIKLLINS